MDSLNKSIHSLSSFFSASGESYQVHPIHMASTQQIWKSEDMYITSKLLVLGDFFHAQVLHTTQNNFFICNYL